MADDDPTLPTELSYAILRDACDRVASQIELLLEEGIAGDRVVEALAVIQELRDLARAFDRWPAMSDAEVERARAEDPPKAWRAVGLALEIAAEAAR